jgi:hypothetical protein
MLAIDLEDYNVVTLLATDQGKQGRTAMNLGKGKDKQRERGMICIQSSVLDYSCVCPFLCTISTHILHPLESAHSSTGLNSLSRPRWAGQLAPGKLLLCPLELRLLEPAEQPWC